MGGVSNAGFLAHDVKKNKVIRNKVNLTNFIRSIIKKWLRLKEKGENKGLGLYLIDEFTYQCSNKKETSYSQFFAILDKYIRANPQYWYQGLFTLINSAFNETEFFRCSKEDYK